MGCASTKEQIQTNEYVGNKLEFVFSDPDLGWRNVTAFDNYPIEGWNVNFKNERTGNFLESINLVVIAINIARRAALLAERYGINDIKMTPSNNDLSRLLKPNNASYSSAYTALGCPKYNWKLLKRSENVETLLKKQRDLFTEDGENKIVNDNLQIMLNPQQKVCVADVAEIAMNISDQLFRLEKFDAENCHQIPDNGFDWKIQTNSELIDCGQIDNNDHNVTIIDSDGEAYLITPEELIMDVTTWVQMTYLTAPVL